MDGDALVARSRGDSLAGVFWINPGRKKLAGETLLEALKPPQPTVTTAKAAAIASNLIGASRYIGGNIAPLHPKATSNLAPEFAANVTGVQRRRHLPSTQTADGGGEFAAAAERHPPGDRLPAHAIAMRRRAAKCAPHPERFQISNLRFQTRPPGEPRIPHAFDGGRQRWGDAPGEPRIPRTHGGGSGFREELNF